MANSSFSEEIYTCLKNRGENCLLHIAKFKYIESRSLLGSHLLALSFLKPIAPRFSDFELRLLISSLKLLEELSSLLDQCPHLAFYTFTYFPDVILGLKRSYWLLQLF